MRDELILQRLAEILRKNGYEVTKKEYTNQDYPSIKQWMKNTELSTRAYNAIYSHYIGNMYRKTTEEKDMLELIADVKSGEIYNLHNVGKKTRDEIADALKITLNIDI